MLRADYFINCLRAGMYVNRQWILNTFGTPIGDRKATKPWQVGIENGVWYVHNADNQREEIDDQPEGNNALFIAGEPITLPAFTLANIKASVETVYAQAMVNAIVLVWPFGDMFDFIPKKKINDKVLKSLITPKFTAKEVSVEQYINVHKALDHLEVFGKLLVRTLTPASLAPTKEALEVRDRLLEQYKDQLHIPAIAAMIDDAIVAADMEALKNDPVMRYFVNKKSFQTVRKKMYGSQGGVARLDDPTKIAYVKGSLLEGVRPEDLPFANNASRSGSYDRGASTAFGGKEAKSSNRTGEGILLKEGDCGTNAGLRLRNVTEEQAEFMVGRFPMGRDTPYTIDEAKGLVGKSIVVRSPVGCNQVDGNYCHRCMGTAVAASSIPLGPQLGSVASIYLSVFLAAFHAKPLTLVPYSFDKYMS